MGEIASRVSSCRRHGLAQVRSAYVDLSKAAYVDHLLTCQKRRPVTRTDVARADPLLGSQHQSLSVAVV